MLYILDFPYSRRSCCPFPLTKTMMMFFSRKLILEVNLRLLQPTKALLLRIVIPFGVKFATTFRSLKSIFSFGLLLRIVSLLLIIWSKEVSNSLIDVSYAKKRKNQLSISFFTAPLPGKFGVKCGRNGKLVGL